MKIRHMPISVEVANVSKADNKIWGVISQMKAMFQNKSSVHIAAFPLPPSNSIGIKMDVFALSWVSQKCLKMLDFVHSTNGS